MEAQDAAGVAHLLRIKEIAAKEGPLTDDKVDAERGAGELVVPYSDASKSSAGSSVKHGFGTVSGETETAKKNVVKEAVEVDLGEAGKKKPAASPSPKPVACPTSPAAKNVIQDSNEPKEIPSKKPTTSPPRSPQKLTQRSPRRQLATRKTVSGGVRKKRAAGGEIDAGAAAPAKSKGRGKASLIKLPKHRLLATATLKRSKVTPPALGRQKRHSAQGEDEKPDLNVEKQALATNATVDESKIPTTKPKSAPSPSEAKATGQAIEMVVDPAAVAPISQHSPITRRNPKEFPVPRGALKTSADTKAGSKGKEDSKPAATSPSRRSTRSSLATGSLPELTRSRRTTRSSAASDFTSGTPTISPIRCSTRSSDPKETPLPVRTNKKATSAHAPTSKAANSSSLSKRKARDSGDVAADVSPSSEAKRNRAAGAPGSEGKAKLDRGGEGIDGAATVPFPMPSAMPTRRSSRKSVPSLKSIEAAVALSASMELPEVASTLEVDGGALEPTAEEEEKKKKKGTAGGSAKRPAAIAIDPVWEHHFDRLIKFKEQNGHTMVPKKYPADQPLSTWVFKQRQERNKQERRRRSTITAERIDRLNSVGFNWRPKETEEYKRLEAARKRAITDAVWESRFQDLLEYKKSEGHTLVPKHYPVNTPLAQWVHRQRTLRKKLVAGEENPKISKEQVARLEKVGFVWDAKQDPRFKEIEAERKRPEVAKLWEKYFKQLMKFKAEEGHCIVPKLYPTNQPLASWVAKQRQQYRLKKEGKHTNMTDEHVRRLEVEGFVFANTRRNKTFAKIERMRKRPQTDALWKKRFRQLLLYKKKKGDTVVPKNYPQNPILSHWVFRQRALYRMLRTGRDSSMTEEQVRKLDKIGFVWTVRHKKDAENEDVEVLDRVAEASDSDDEGDSSSDDSSTSSSSSDSDTLSESDSSSSDSSSDEDSSNSLRASQVQHDKQSVKVAKIETFSEGKAKGDAEEMSESANNVEIDSKSSAVKPKNGSSKHDVKVGEQHAIPSTIGSEGLESKEAGNLRRSGRRRHNSYEDKFGCFVKEWA